MFVFAGNISCLDTLGVVLNIKLMDSNVAATATHPSGQHCARALAPKVLCSMHFIISSRYHGVWSWLYLDALCFHPLAQPSTYTTIPLTHNGDPCSIGVHHLQLLPNQVHTRGQSAIPMTLKGLWLYPSSAGGCGGHQYQTSNPSSSTGVKHNTKTHFYFIHQQCDSEHTT